MNHFTTSYKRCSMSEPDFEKRLFRWEIVLFEKNKILKNWFEFKETFLFISITNWFNATKWLHYHHGVIWTSSHWNSIAFLVINHCLITESNEKKNHLNCCWIVWEKMHLFWNLNLNDDDDGCASKSCCHCIRPNFLHLRKAILTLD